MNDERIKALFRAFREKDDTAFHRVAEAIIAEELAANHHNFATELKRALGHERMSRRSLAQSRNLTFLPRGRRNGENLVILDESSVSETRIVLGHEPKQKIDRIVEEHRKRSKLARYGYSPKIKFLFWGPPGCGKTFTAYYLAHELGVPVGVLRLNAVISSFLGDTAYHLQRVFDLASTRPMVLLLDEVDAVGKNRDDRNDVGELKRVVNSLLQAMDLFRTSQSIVIAASNHQYLLDPAIWRRFDDIVHFPLPGRAERERYLHLLLNGVKFEGSFSYLAKNLSSLSYGEIESITLEAIKTMILEDKSNLRSDDIIKQFHAYKRGVSGAQCRQLGVRK